MIHKKIDQIIHQVLLEDAVRQDITTRYLVPRKQRSSAYILVKEDTVLCGLEVAKRVFKKIDPAVKLQSSCRDGQKVRKGKRILSIKGRTRTILSGERVALNFLAHLSGIATMTNKFVKKASPYKAKILDTRKTTPGLRVLEKMAVRCGGGTNHRFDLRGMILIKDNHHRSLLKEKPLFEIIKQLKKKTKKPIMIEVENLNQFEEALSTKPNYILLDNMTTGQMKKAVALNKNNKNRCQLEASGGVTLKNVQAIAQTGVDRISVGALTHSIKAIDFSLEI